MTFYRRGLDACHRPVRYSITSTTHHLNPAPSQLQEPDYTPAALWTYAVSPASPYSAAALEVAWERGEQAEEAGKRREQEREMTRRGHRAPRSRCWQGQNHHCSAERSRCQEEACCCRRAGNH